MPFTLSHIAAVLPGYRALSRRHLFTAAVIGSMVPDFGMLLPISPGRLETHSFWPGLITFSLPLGLILYWLTLTLIKPAITEILPDGPYARLRQTDARMPAPSLRGWIYAAVAILGGAITHLVWDGFTHENAPGVRMFPVLDDFAPQIDGHSLQLYRWLQYGSSVLGLIVVIVALVLWLRHVPHPPQRPRRWLGMRERCAWFCLYLMLPLLAIAQQLWHFRIPGRAPPSLGATLDILATVGMRVSALTLLFVSLVLRARLANRFQSRAEP